MTAGARMREVCEFLTMNVLLRRTRPLPIAAGVHGMPWNRDSEYACNFSRNCYYTSLAMPRRYPEKPALPLLSAFTQRSNRKATR